MSKFSKRDGFTTKKQESISSKKDVANNQATTLKKQTTSSMTKISTHGKETSKANDENDRQKAKLKVDANKKSKELKTTNKLVSRSFASSPVNKKKPLLRAKQTSNLTETVKKNLTSRTNVSEASKKRNAVLDTPHNVTVSSPPPQRYNPNTSNVKSANKVSTEVQKDSKPNFNRKNSRTLAPEEILILKRDADNMPLDRAAHSKIITVKDPVAFEVKFEEKVKPTRSISNMVAKSNKDCADNVTLLETNDVEQNYSDDFETYESDFETESSTQSMATADRSSTGSDDESEECSETTSQSTQGQSTIDDSKDESEITQNPVTVIQQAVEKKLDSGHYEMNSRRSNNFKLSDTSNSIQHLMDSIDISSLGLTDQLDSGISAYEVSTFPPSDNNRNIEIVFGGYKDFNSKPIVNQRGLELMSKIQFDVLSFTLLDFKPISYDVFMQTFGKLNTQQCSTQTQDNLIDTEQQTDVYETCSKWTQHPVQYDVRFDNNQISCGSSISETYADKMPECRIEQSLQVLNGLTDQNLKHIVRNHQKSQRKPFDYENLNSFLLRTSIILNQIINPPNSSDISSFSTQNVENAKDQIFSRISNNYYYLDTTFLNALRVLKIFSNNKYNLLITVHESLPDSNVYSSDFSNLLMVWSINVIEKPLRLLTTWSQVSHIEISNDSSDVVVAALRDGSIALWDLRETYSFCSKLDGHLTHFAATQSVVPSLYGIRTKSVLAMDLGSCLDIKSFKSQHNAIQVKTKFPETQFVSLHDSGVLTVWTLIQASDTNFGRIWQTTNTEKSKCSKMGQTLEFISPWAQIKLLQSTIFNVKDYLETKSQQTQSRFDKTKTLFQKDIYSDEVLKELNQLSSDIGQQGLRLTSLECGSNNLFICTNRNFILMCSKTLKMDRLKRIMINESRFLFPTALKVLNNENFLAVGLSNGAVVILNCQSRKPIQNRELMKTPKSSKKDSLYELNSATAITGKSCAIQNIILNSQKSYENIDFNHQQQYRPNTAAFVSLIESKRQPFELRVLDQQTIMNGTVLRKNLIQTLELSSDGWRLFALTNGHLRVYDFYLDNEIAYQEIQETGKIIDIATGKCGSNIMNLMILKPNTQVEVYILNT